MINKQLTRLLQLFIGLLFFSSMAKGQVARKANITELQQRVTTITDFRRTQPNKVIENELFDQKLDSVLNTVSGATYLNGKAALTSASVDDKGLTVNYNFNDGYQHTWQVTASGTAKKGLVDLFSGGKYSKTLTGGINYFYFPLSNRASAAPGESDRLHTRIDRINRNYANKRDLAAETTELHSMKTIFDTYGGYFYSSVAIPSNVKAVYDAQYTEFSRLLKKYAYYLPANFETLALTDQQAAINDLDTHVPDIIQHYYYKQQVDTLIKVQLSVNFNKKFLNWWLLSAKINHDAYPIFDGTAAKKDYVSTKDDYYPSFSVGYSAVWLRPKANWMLLPLFKYQNSRDFKTGNLLSLNIPQNPRDIAGQTISDYKTTSFYGEVADRKKVINAELPGIVFFPKANVPFGLELAVNTNLLDKIDNFGGRFGVYVVLPGAKQSVVIEPLVRVDPWKAGNTSFGKDQLSFGINLTVALPAYITGIK